MLQNLYLNPKKIYFQNKNYTFNEKFVNNQLLVFDVFNDMELENLYYQAKIWRINVRNRVNLVLFLFLFCVCVFLIGVIVFLYGLVKLRTHFGIISVIVGVIAVLISILLPIVLYFADNWNNPYLYDWSQKLKQLKPYLIDTLELPYTIRVLLFPEINELIVNSPLMLLKAKRLIEIPKKLMKYIKVRIEANNVYEDEKIDHEDLKTLFQFWGNLQVIYEWACFLESYTLVCKKENKW